MENGAITILTVGHGSRSIEELLGILHENDVQVLVDVRSSPNSIKYPHFSKNNLAMVLGDGGIRYEWYGRDLGGFRGSSKHSAHTMLGSKGLQAYAKHMETDTFRRSVGRLLELAMKGTVAILCAERLPWRCHRFFLSDYLTLRGVRVLHMVNSREVVAHRQNPLARVERGRLIYDRHEQQRFDL